MCSPNYFSAAAGACERTSLVGTRISTAAGALHAQHAAVWRLGKALTDADWLLGGAGPRTGGCTPPACAPLCQHPCHQRPPAGGRQRVPASMPASALPALLCPRPCPSTLARPLAMARLAIFITLAILTTLPSAAGYDIPSFFAAAAAALLGSPRRSSTWQLSGSSTPGDWLRANTVEELVPAQIAALVGGWVQGSLHLPCACPAHEILCASVTCRAACLVSHPQRPAEHPPPLLQPQLSWRRCCCCRSRWALPRWRKGRQAGWARVLARNAAVWRVCVGLPGDSPARNTHCRRPPAAPPPSPSHCPGLPQAAAAPARGWEEQRFHLLAPPAPYYSAPRGSRPCHLAPCYRRRRPPWR